MSKQKNKETETKHATLGLKVRRAEAVEAPVVNKPRKMNLVKPKRISAKTDDFANSALLVFPTDRLGVSTEVKGALIRAATRIGKDEAAFAILQEAVEIGMKHVEARMKQNQELPKLKQRVDTKGVTPGDTEPPEADEEAPEGKDTPKKKKPSSKAKKGKK